MSTIKIFSLLILCIFVVALFRSIFFYHKLPDPQPCANSNTHRRITLKNDPNILKRFIGGLNIPTISYKIHTYDEPQFLKIIDYIQENYPYIHNSNFVNREVVAKYSLLYTVYGKDPNLKPYMLTSHLDVVPAIREKWSSDPFDATVKEDGYLYARGTIDAKHLVFAMLETLEHLLKFHYRPKRTIYIAFGHDEEVMGLDGAQNISAILKEKLKKSNHNKLEFMVDEGLIISKTRFPGVDNDVAFVGVSEKGYLSVKLSSVGAIGHGSLPLEQTAISKLGQVIGRFHSNILPSFLGQGVEREMFDIFAQHSSWPMKFVYANFWLFKPIIGYIFSKDPTLNALVRTSTAVTMIRGGIKENVLPDSAYAIINHRIHQAQTSQDVIDFDLKLINDPTIKLELLSKAFEAHPVSPYDDNSYGYQVIKQTILQVYSNTVVVPSIFLAATDSKWYLNITESVYRFSAIAVYLTEMNRFHGHDERISLKNYENLINFYHHLILNSDKDLKDFKPEVKEEL